MRVSSAPDETSMAGRWPADGLVSDMVARVGPDPSASRRLRVTIAIVNHPNVVNRLPDV
jgi:hypothetical protein